MSDFCLKNFQDSLKSQGLKASVAHLYRGKLPAKFTVKRAGIIRSRC